jgi:hypothetical protein
MMLVLLAALAAPKDYTDAKPNDFGLEWVEAKKDAKSGFVVGGKNDTALIKKLTEINGIKIEDLEKVMRPGKSSTAGFLGPEEKLLEVMAADNDYVLGELGLTHQEIARPLLLLGAIAARRRASSPTAGCGCGRSGSTSRATRIRRSRTARRRVRTSSSPTWTRARSCATRFWCRT